MDAPSPPARIVPVEGTETAPGPILRGFPRDLVERAAHNVGTAALSFAAAYAIGVGVNEFFAHTLGPVPPHGWQISHTMLVCFILLSLLVFWISRSGRRSAEQVLDAALAYEVVGGFLISLGTTSGMIWDERAHIFGLSWVCVWITGFPFLVPSTAGRAAMVALGTALTVPLGLWAWHQISGTPMPGARTWSGVTVPTLICAGIAVAGSKIHYGLGRAVEKAREMGAYRLEEPIASGGMGTIWRARHRMLARPAAVKLVRLDVLGDASARRSAVARFEREAQVTARLSSPHTVRLYDYGISEEGALYYVMELLEGMDLERLVRQHGPVEAERAVRFLSQACRSLAEAHDLGLIHRDIKPANLFACRQGNEYDIVKILDFGLARREAAETADLTRITAAAAMVGTPAYLAPESALGGEIGPWTDLYSLGCVGYWLLTGRPVFHGETPIQVVLGHVREAPVPPRTFADVDIPEELERAILQCLEKEPAKRPPAAERLAEQLDEIPLALPWTPARAQAWWANVARA